MLADTHCHINNMVKKEFDVSLTEQDIANAKKIIQQAEAETVTTIINVGTSIQESKNCIALAEKFPHIFATIGIHPTDCTENWKADVQELKKLIVQSDKIVGIGECGLDLYHKDTPLDRQISAFHAQIELALTHNKALVVHSRDAYDETLKLLELYKKENMRAVMHCFSYDNDFAQTIIEWNFYLGIGGTITYPKNELLRSAVQKSSLAHIVLETDAPFLPMQSMRGQQNHPKYIKEIAHAVAEIKETTFDDVARQTTQNAFALFALTNSH
jgi:TatD DNase family protein